MILTHKKPDWIRWFQRKIKFVLNPISLVQYDSQSSDPPYTLNIRWKFSSLVVNVSRSDISGSLDHPIS